MAAPGCGHGSGSGCCPAVSYDEHLLVYQWPIAHCNTNKINCNYQPIPRQFTLHGLWHNKDSEGANCPTPYPRIKLCQQIRGKLRKDMEKIWPNLNNKRHPEYLWEHEYETHGYCFTEFRNQVDYFQTALDIATDIGDVMTMRLSSGETLKSGEFYQVQDFKHVTIAGRTLIPTLRCNYASGRKHPQLHEIVFCTDRNKILKSCTSNVKVCNRPWKDCNGVVWSGWFEFP